MSKFLILLAFISIILQSAGCAVHATKVNKMSEQVYNNSSLVNPLPPHAFKSDGCSCWPDGDRVDYTYQAEVLEAAAHNGVARLFLISSPQASIKSPFFYSRMKAELDARAESLPFSTRVYFRPAIIRGDRPDNRLGEKLGGLISERLASWVPGMQKYRPIHARTLATAIVNCACARLPAGSHNYALDDIFELA